jgi:hypothetical protein
MRRDLRAAPGTALTEDVWAGVVPSALPVAEVCRTNNETGDPLFNRTAFYVSAAVGLVRRVPMIRIVELRPEDMKTPARAERAPVSPPALGALACWPNAGHADREIRSAANKNFICNSRFILSLRSDRQRAGGRSSPSSQRLCWNTNS